MKFRPGALGMQILVIGLIHFLLVALIVAAPSIGLGNDESFIMYVRYQLTRTDCLIFVVVSFAFIVGVASLRAAIGTLALAIWVASFFGGLYAFDYFIALRPGDMIHYGGETKTTIYTLDLHPYTGWHIQPNFDYAGDLPEKQSYHNYEIKSGDMGFFIDFPLRNPPAKKPGEYRIILIGGSGAQGFGARTNDDMLYRKLETILNERAGREGLTFRVINMSMAGSVTYQNFVALNRFAHPMNPDLILSYSGANDFSVPALHEHRTDGFFDFGKLKQLAISTRPSEYPPILRPFAAMFPNIFNHTHFGIAMKQLFPSYFLHRAREAYKDATGLRYDETQTFLDDYAVPFYVDAMKSIKRDFDGIPMMIAWQVMKPGTGVEHRNVTGKLSADFYNRMYRQAAAALAGYRNDKWIFYNAHEAASHTPGPDFATHLSNQGHTVVAQWIADEILAKAELLNNFNMQQ